MKRRLAYLPFLVFIWLDCLSTSFVFASEVEWTEEKIGKLAVKADKAARVKKWAKAIKYGEKMLEGSVALYHKEAPYTITRAKTLNRYYDHAGRLAEIAERVQNTYVLSKKYFEPTHDTAQISRLLYYKLLIDQKNYAAAIPLVYENMALLSDSEDDAFQRLHYLNQLHGLYGATNQLPQQEKILREQLALNQRLMGMDISDSIEIIMNLARTYCLQNKVLDFNQLMQTYGLKYKC